ncbi:hypothetical protein ANN_20745 [Periplaneta americana]|uniref:NADH dehydrogenase [ubiquinone] 1 alpha subcomplex subunit 8 n=1 Tax=Periplaneta americana TaxID=6978 RepID=A0ABQ8SDF9_PERAM|nr:hypothetical protein ANN_20745 [Periplaneta americana]
MVVTANTYLPTEEELTVQEVNLSGPALRAGAFHLGKHCEYENNEFILCRKELDDPRKCIDEGKAVTSCALNFFVNCRKTQAAYDKCIKDNLGIDRPEYGYFCRAKVHDTKRPKPEPKKPDVYPDYTPYLPEDYPKPPAKYGSRFHWLN